MIDLLSLLVIQVSKWLDWQFLLLARPLNGSLGNLAYQLCQLMVSQVALYVIQVNKLLARQPSLLSRSAAKQSSSNELAPVQLTKQLTISEGTEMDSLLRADRVIHRPPDNLWVVQSADKLLAKYIVNAVVHGESTAPAVVFYSAVVVQGHVG